MKIKKVILFIFAIFLLGTFSASATVVTDSVSVDILSADACVNGATNYPTCTKCLDSSTTTIDKACPCTNGATNPPLCNNIICKDSSCSTCPPGSVTPEGKICPGTSDIKPDLKVSVHSNYVNVDNADELVSSFDAYPINGYPYTLSWGPVANATSCDLDGGTVADVNGGSFTWMTHSYTNNYHDFVLKCTGADGLTGSDTLRMSYPPLATNLTYTCNASNTKAHITWTDPANYTTFYARASSEKGGYNVNPSNDHTVVYDDNYTGNSYDMNVNPTEKYSFWIHSKNMTTQAYGPADIINIECKPSASTGTWGAWSNWDYSVSACGSTGTKTRTRICSAPGTCTGSDTETVSYSTPICQYGVLISATPSSIRIGKTTKITWSSTDMDSCKGTSSDAGFANKFLTGSNTSGSYFSPALEKSTTYSLSCTAADGTVKTGSVQVKIDATTIQEI